MSLPMRLPLPLRFLVALAMLATVGLSTTADAGPFRRNRDAQAVGPTPRKQAPYAPGASPYVTGINSRPRYYVPPTNPRTPTWKMYGTEPGVVPGDWPRYAPFGFGGYRFPAVGNAAYR
jgi:hypothetical protein